MSKFQAVLGLVFVTAGLGSGGCSGSDYSDEDGDEHVESSGSVGAFCDDYCDKEYGCDRHVDVQTCTNDCASELAASGSKLRTAYVSGISECFKAADCASVIAGDAFGACVDEVKAALSLSDAGRRFCTELGAALGKCDASFDKADCYDVAKTYGDAALAEAQQCLDKSCSGLGDCVSATL